MGIGAYARRAVASSFMALLIGAGAVQASLDEVPMPKPRPMLVLADPATGLPRLLPVFGPSKSQLRPRPRPNAAQVQTVGAITPAAVPASAGGLTTVIMPEPRPTTAQPARYESTVKLNEEVKGGKICGNKAIIGQKVAPVSGHLSQCGISKPVAVTSVSGVALSQASIMDCDTAAALNNWVASGIKPAIGKLGGGVKSLTVVAHYSCRTRNSQPGAKVSEHGKGRAIDIAAVNLKNGKSLDVEDDWGKGSDGKLLKRVHKSACGPFGTVLGPNADQYHQDHIHVDIARYSGGTYCR